MGVIRDSLTASAALFTFALAVGYYLEKRSEEVIYRLVDKLLDNQELEDMVYEYVNVLVKRFSNDPIEVIRFERFVRNVAKSDPVQTTAKSLIVESVLGDRFMKQLVKDMIQRIKKEKPNLSLIYERNEILTKSFAWGGHSIDYLFSDLNNLHPLIFQAPVPQSQSNTEIQLNLYTRSIKTLNQQIFYHLKEPARNHMKFIRKLKKFDGLVQRIILGNFI